MLTDEQRKRLNAPIPESAIKQRKGGAGKQLDYIEHFRVVSLLNDIIGNGAWRTDIIELRLTFEGTVDTENGPRAACSYVARVRMHGDGWSYEDVGFGTDRGKDPSAIHEKAVKEAVSDAEKRCARHLGWSMGLALYEKVGEQGTRTHVSGVDAAIVAACETATTADELGRAKAAAKLHWSALPKPARERVAAAVRDAEQRITATDAAQAAE
jgi:DNA recombination protein Rad52